MGTESAQTMEMHVKVQDKLGTFARYADRFSITDLDGNPVDKIEFGKTIVHGPFKLVTKRQIAIVIAVVTKEMVNGTNKDGKPVYEFASKTWRPKALVGDFVLQDAEEPADRWACGSDLFHSDSGWIATVHDNGYVTYGKHGKPVPAIEVPEGTIVDSREGPQPAPAGSMLTFLNVNEGDFYLWSPDTVRDRVKDYIAS